MSRQISHDGRGALRVEFRYDPRLVERVKSLPTRRWVAAEKYWSVPEGEVVALVDLLYGEGFKFDATVRRLYAQHGGTLSLSASDPPPRDASQRALFGGADAAEAPFTSLAPIEGDKPAGSPDDYSVSRLNRAVKAALEAAFPQAVWIVGEISGFNKSAHKKFVSFSLVERTDSGDTVAEVGAVLFPEARAAIEGSLRAAGDPFRLEDEIRVRVRGRVDLYEAWGSYRIRIEDVDLAYTLGEAARRRDEIVRKLTEEGLAGRNPSLPFPDLPLRVGLITSLGSDAFNDVLKTLRESGFAFELTAHGARVQGRSTEPSVLNALDWFAARRETFDVVLICRGGGSRTDLAWFDSEAIGRAVAAFPLPVVVGIGHEQDVSVLDFVARRAKTPTAAAQMLVATVEQALDTIEGAGVSILDAARLAVDDAAERLAERARRVARATRGRLEIETREMARAGRDLPRAAARLLDRSRLAVEQAARQASQGARRDLAAASRRIDDARSVLPLRAARALALAEERNEARARRLHLVDPRRVVERGYAVLRGASGRVLTDAADAPSGTALAAELRRGTLRLRSEGEDPSDRSVS